MKKILMFVFAVLVIFGAGCSSTQKEPKGPSDQELARMSATERDDAMKEMMKEYPMPTLSTDQKEQEAKNVREMVKDDKQIMRVANFSSRAHEAKGSARIVKRGDRYSLVISEDFEVDPGPYLVFVLSGRTDPQNSAELHVQGYLEVGRLKSANGGQVFELPANFDPSLYHAISVYCKPFKVIFATGQFK